MELPWPIFDKQNLWSSVQASVAKTHSKSCVISQRLLVSNWHIAHFFQAIRVEQPLFETQIIASHNGNGGRLGYIFHATGYDPAMISHHRLVFVSKLLSVGEKTVTGN
jgi:hypothetical protein